MRNVLRMLAIAGLVAFTGNAASSQGFDVRIGTRDGGPDRYERRIDRDRNVRIERRVYRDDVRPGASRRIVERRIVRPVPRTRTVCRTVIRERVVRAGFVVRRPARVCTTRTRF